MKKLIFADDLKEAIIADKDTRHNGKTIAEVFCGYIDAAPDAVVRCKNCDNYDMTWMPLAAGGDPNVHYCMFFDACSRDDGFCGFGEPREEVNNGKTN